MFVASALVMAAPLPAQDRFFTSDGIRIRYVEQGEGEAVILVHGYTGSAETWVTSGILADLARDHRVIALDLRGHGTQRSMAASRPTSSSYPTAP
jgi:pimeloyl-ACP methyl ester carboxylesterase